MGHIIAHARGGSNDLSNIMPICHRCNGQMSDMDMREYVARYHPDSKIRLPVVTTPKPIIPDSIPLNFSSNKAAWLVVGGIIMGLIGAYVIIVMGEIMFGGFFMFVGVLFFALGGGQKYIP
jgi:hypothetical protein